MKQLRVSFLFLIMISSTSFIQGYDWGKLLLGAFCGSYVIQQVSSDEVCNNAGGQVIVYAESADSITTKRSTVTYIVGDGECAYTLDNLVRLTACPSDDFSETTMCGAPTKKSLATHCRWQVGIKRSDSLGDQEEVSFELSFAKNSNEYARNKYGLRRDDWFDLCLHNKKKQNNNK